MPNELGGTLDETACRKKTVPSKLVISFQEDKKFYLTVLYVQYRTLKSVLFLHVSPRGLNVTNVTSRYITLFIMTLRNVTERYGTLIKIKIIPKKIF
jgi:hypothetical protein